ncbi:hypothetical protein AMAG_19678 [Allomyces macrogynus ATCC 38327]|uniref:Uncharacterized protein n=1 Tax=Allomyces macrogynus (strain ATCC 38327) TaxID=578462 RepID=A0A0L0SY07_ALLM3|nr:hypothetical protein AMAG_19678 [Allomyces macrogynus ATCC 38327]|eukprot:KNE67280.1 hypothetical protein AMAG_19678 [Allomyces macrogynus ATCC 38327]
MAICSSLVRSRKFAFCANMMSHSFLVLFWCSDNTSSNTPVRRWVGSFVGFHSGSARVRSRRSPCGACWLKCWAALVGPASAIAIPRRELDCRFPSCINSLKASKKKREQWNLKHDTMSTAV